MKRGKSESIEDLCEKIKAIKDRRVIHTTIAGVEVTMTIIRSDTMLIMHSSISDHCFELVIYKQEAELKNLLLPSKKDCPNFPSGGQLLTFVDQVNECFDVKVCRLTNAATFDIEGADYDADCLYARDHHGLGFYMSRGYLIRKSTLEKSVLKSNQTIEEWNDFWNSGRFDKNITPQCGFHPSGREMVKYYDVDIHIYKPRNPFAPAVIIIGAVDPKRVERMENFDYRAGWESGQAYKRALQEENTDDDMLFTLLRRTYPAPNDEAIRKQVEMDIRLPWNQET